MIRGIHEVRHKERTQKIWVQNGGIAVKAVPSRSLYLGCGAGRYGPTRLGQKLLYFRLHLAGWGKA